MILLSDKSPVDASVSSNTHNSTHVCVLFDRQYDSNLVCRNCMTLAQTSNMLTSNRRREMATETSDTALSSFKHSTHTSKIQVTYCASAQVE